MSTRQIDESISKIQLMNDVQIDCGTEQGEDIFFEKLSKHSQLPRELYPKFEWYVAETEKCIEEIQGTIKPYSLPDDYLFFLKTYGGMTISNTNFYFVALGMGPMVEEWYSYLLAEGEGYENGFLRIGFIRYRNSKAEKWKYTSFVLDLGSTIQPNSIIELHDWNFGELNVQDFYNSPQSYSSNWSVIADSFTKWLELVANTGGSFGYLNR